MKKPILEVIRFDEADIVTASGLGFTAANFGNEIPKDGTFTFFGGSSGDKSHNAHDENIVSAFNQYFSRGWGSTEEIWVYWSNGGESSEGTLAALIGEEIHDDPLDNSKFNRTYTYKNGEFHWRSN